MRKLDRSRPFAEEWGAGGVTGYSQDGIDFDIAGNEARGDLKGGDSLDSNWPTAEQVKALENDPVERLVPRDAPAPKKLSRSEALKAAWAKRKAAKVAAEPKVPVAFASTPEGGYLNAAGMPIDVREDGSMTPAHYAKMSEEELRAMIEVRGDTYTDRKSAIAMLENDA